MTGAAVEVVDVRKRFGRTHALAGVTLRAEPGITGLLGPNGAGKTTLLRMLATVLAPDSGRLRLLGCDPSRSDERLSIRRRLGYVPQEPGLYQHFTVFEFVDYVAILKEMTDRRARHDDVRRVLALVGLTDDRPRPRATAAVPRVHLERRRTAHGRAVDAPDRRRRRPVSAGGCAPRGCRPFRRHDGRPGKCGSWPRVAGR